MKIWILTGNEENWETAFNHGNIWGVREGGLVNRWKKLEKGDLLLFYVKSPVKGIIGVGKTESKFKQDKPLWPDEIRANKVIYPYRFDFQVLAILLPEKWRTEVLSVSDLPLSIQAGVNPIGRKEVIDELMSRASDKFNVNLGKVEGEEQKVKFQEQSPHNQIKEKLVEIGQLEHFISEKEYPIDGERLDVTWRKVVRGVPTKAFEIQVGGNPHQALAKLKHAFDLWNSEPYLIIDEKARLKVEELLAGTFHELQPHIKVIPLNKIEEFYKLLSAEEEFKQLIGV